MITKRRFLSSACAGSLAAILPNSMRRASAQTVSRMLVGFGAGGTIDVIARMLVQGMKGYSSSFIVENRPGGNTNIATAAVAHASADGYTLIMTTTTNTINASLYDRLNFNFGRDIAPIAAIIRLPLTRRFCAACGWTARCSARSCVWVSPPPSE